MPDVAPTWEIVRATGTCCACDTKFYDKDVARMPSPCAPCGWAYMELRHLPDEVVAALPRATSA